MLMTSLAGVHAVHSLAMFQVDAADNSKLVTYVGIAAVALAIQSLISIGFVIGGFVALKTLMKEVAELKLKVLPFVEKSHALVTDLTPEVKQITTKVHTLVTDLSPKINEITSKVNTLVGDVSPHIVAITGKVHDIATHAEEIAGVAKDKVNEFSPTISAANETVQQTNQTVREAVADASEKTRKQVDRVNGMISSTLDATARLGRAIEHGITQPGREVAGVLSGVKAAFETLVQRGGALKNFGFGVKQAPKPYRAPVVPYARPVLTTNIVEPDGEL